MTRLLALMLLAYLVYLGLKTLMFRLQAAVRVDTLRPEEPPRRVHATVLRPEGEELIACTRCGVHVPHSRTRLGERGEVLCADCGATP
ncbi:MAG TPA: hypothetical protein VJ885_12550 [Thermoanaerobaculia bacterium]|nr:hypothetical protein [Thermoanaerobaculia bacterium]